MSGTLIHCPKCHTALTNQAFNQDDFAPCPSCTALLQVEVFPAMFRRAAQGRAAEPVQAEAEAGCFYHPQKRAVLPCDGCGRFLCALCDCEHNGQHLCPACLETGRTKGKIKSLEDTRVRYDLIALSLAILPVLILYFTIVTAPLVLYVSIRYWRAPLGLTQGSRLCFVLAILIATLELTGWAFLLIGLAAR